MIVLSLKLFLSMLKVIEFIIISSAKSTSIEIVKAPYENGIDVNEIEV